MLGNQQQVFALIAQLGGSRNKIVLDRTLCKFMGSLHGGVFLSQLLYWSDKGGKGEWFYKSYAEWEEETTLSEYQVRQSAKLCIEMGFLDTKVAKANGSPTVHYCVGFSIFMDCILKYLGMEDEISNELYTETTTKTTAAEAAAASPSLDPVTKFVDAYHSIWGLTVASPYIGDKIKEWAERVTIEGWKYALEECVKSKKHGNWKYFEGILGRIESDGYQPKDTPIKSESQLDFIVEDLS